MLGLLGPHARHPGLRTQLTNRSLHGLDLVDLEVAFHSFLALLPQPPVQRFLASGRHLRRVEPNVELQSLAQPFGELIRLGKEVTGVDADDPRARRDRVHEVASRNGWDGALGFEVPEPLWTASP